MVRNAIKADFKLSEVLFPSAQMLRRNVSHPRNNFVSQLPRLLIIGALLFLNEYRKIDKG